MRLFFRKAAIALSSRLLAPTTPASRICQAEKDAAACRALLNKDNERLDFASADALWYPWAASLWRFSRSEVPSSRHLLRGWIVGKPGCLFTDIRVRYEGRLWPAVHGFIRADLAAHFGHPTPNLPAEFTVLISLAPGTASIEFEALGISGVWRPVHTVQVKVTGSAAPPFQPDPEAPVHAHEFVRLQRYLLCNIAAEPAFSLATHVDRLVGMLPSPRYLRHPALPLRGFFHEPAIIARALYGRLMVDGYLFHEHQTIRRVLATFDLQVWQPLSKI